MTNREKYGEEILDILESGNNFTVTKDGKIGECRPIFGNCNTCLFCETVKYDTNCRESKGFWLKKEYVKKPKITENEIGVLTLIKPIFQYIARDKDGKIYLYSKKPIKGVNKWICNADNNCDDMTMFIKSAFIMIEWEDEEPWKIEDLLKLELEEQ